MTRMWYEDILLGETRELGSYTFTEDEIVAFAKRYDPQPFHIDPEAAKHSLFGGIIASGWHTAAIWMKLAIAMRARDAAAGVNLARSGVSPGFENMRWHKPVRAGMTLFYSTTPVEKVDLKSRPEWGLIKTRNEARDEAGDLVFSFVGKGLVARKPKESSP
jgi:acyl dehydratase